MKDKKYTEEEMENAKEESFARGFSLGHSSGWSSCKKAILRMLGR